MYLCSCYSGGRRSLADGLCLQEQHQTLRLLGRQVPDLLILLHHVAAPAWWTPSRGQPARARHKASMRADEQQRGRCISVPLNPRRTTPVLAYSCVDGDHTSTGTCPCVGEEREGRLRLGSRCKRKLGDYFPAQPSGQTQSDGATLVNGSNRNPRPVVTLWRDGRCFPTMP